MENKELNNELLKEVSGGKEETQANESKYKVNDYVLYGVYKGSANLIGQITNVYFKSGEWNYDIKRIYDTLFWWWIKSSGEDAEMSENYIVKKGSIEELKKNKKHSIKSSVFFFYPIIPNAQRHR